ncbi:MAG: polysaccharide biosynthesis/export family protein [Chromatiales bacterium]|jgi:polysaccharide export outer membrane protein|nr:polysaccharide biosynthesis/export family protein [Chromatiales bacterium]
MRIRNFFLPLLLLLSIAVSSVHAADPADNFLLGPGDVIKATVFGHPDLATVARIGEDGKISFPLIGDVLIGGLSSSGAEAKISDLLLQQHYVTDAQVSLFVQQRRQTLANSVLILGHIAHPGKYALQGVADEGVQTLIDLIAVAGGTSADSSDRLMLLRRDGDDVHKVQIDLRALLGTGELQQNVGLIGGDIIFVPEAEVFYVLGQVQSPGRYRLERGMSVMQALAVGGGINPRGNENGITIKRRGEDGVVASGSAKLTDEIRANDVIYVKESLF